MFIGLIERRFCSLLKIKNVQRISVKKNSNSNSSRVDKKPIKRSMYAYKRSLTSYHDWVAAVNRVEIVRSDFHRPFIVRSTIRQILRFMTDGFIENDQWRSFRDYLVRRDIGVSRLFDGIFLHECINHHRLLMGLSYFEHLRSEQISLTPKILAMFLLLARQIDGRKEFEENRIDEQTIVEIYQEFLSHQIQVDSSLALPLIAGLTLTSKWKDSLKYLPILDNDLDGLQQALGFVLTAAASFKDYPFFFSFIDTISQTEQIRIKTRRENLSTKPNEKQKQQTQRTSPIKENDFYLISKTSQAYETFTNFLTGEKNQQIEIIVKLLEKTASNGYIPPKSFVVALKTKLENLDPKTFRCEFTFFRPNGESIDGKSRLTPIGLNDEQLENLHQNVRKNFTNFLKIFSPNLAENSSRLFDELSKPFDVLFDCLHYPPLEIDWRIRHPLYIKRIIHQITAEKGKNCFVLARNELADYIESLEIPRDLVSVLRVPFQSDRSPLPVLSAIFHGKTTLLASPIDQRSYKSLLAEDFIDLFDRWIQTHQLVPVAKPDLVFLQAPNCFSTRVHLIDNQWLIPFFDGSPLTEADVVHTWFRVEIQ